MTENDFKEGEEIYLTKRCGRVEPGFYKVERSAFHENKLFVFNPSGEGCNHYENWQKKVAPEPCIKHGFSIGDVVKRNSNGEYVVVSGVPGDPVYDDCHFAGADEGFTYNTGYSKRWAYQKDFKQKVACPCGAGEGQTRSLTNSPACNMTFDMGALKSAENMMSNGWTWTEHQFSNPYFGDSLPLISTTTWGNPKKGKSMLQRLSNLPQAIRRAFDADQKALYRAGYITEAGKWTGKALDEANQDLVNKHLDDNRKDFVERANESIELAKEEESDC